MVRLRQVAFAANDLPAAEAALIAALGVDLCYRDPNLTVFGLRNALFPVGDQFVEIVSPVQDGTTAGRLIAKRGGDCGYMVLFQVDDLGPVELRLAAAGIRVVFDAAAADIRGLHLHPKDVPGAIVSVDSANEPAEWPWAGPTWRDHVDTTTASAIVAMEVAVEDTAGAAEIWAQVLGIRAAGDTFHVDDAIVRFVEPGHNDRRRGITAIDFTTTRSELVGTSLDVLGVTVRFVEIS
jgi:Glyoxalase-like domain